MVEAFRRHLPIWVILAGVLLAAIVITYFVFVDNRVVEESDEPANEEQPGPTPDDIALREVANGFNAPVDIVNSGLEGDERLFIVEQVGRIRILENGQASNEPVLDISDQVIFDGEQGLLGLAFDPDLDERPYIYVNFVRVAGGERETVVARYELNDDQTKADENSMREILTIQQPYANHNGGDIVFGPDGYLYIASGDGGSGGDPQNNAQNIDSLLGKILRIDVRNQPYDVPDDNPFVGRDGRDELWAYGLRNPWRMSFDAAGNLWIGDVGQGEYEEVNFLPVATAGSNYGWRCYEGLSEFNTSGCGNESDYVMPRASYSHEGSGCSGSITGGYVYEGEAYPGLAGDYIFADYCTGTVYRIDAEDTEPEVEAVAETDYGIATFGIDTSGELYLADARNGTIYQVVAQ